MNVLIGISTGFLSSQSIKTTLSETKSSEVTTTAPAQTSSILFDTSSASSKMITVVSATGVSKETTKTATKSTTVGTTSGTGASTTGNVSWRGFSAVDRATLLIRLQSTSTTSASASPTTPKKSNAVGQASDLIDGATSAFIAGAGIIVLAAMLEGL